MQTGTKQNISTPVALHSIIARTMSPFRLKEALMVEKKNVKPI
jgi:hypothetical protein